MSILEIILSIILGIVITILFVLLSYLLKIFFGALIEYEEDSDDRYNDYGEEGFDL